MYSSSCFIQIVEARIKCIFFFWSQKCLRQVLFFVFLIVNCFTILLHCRVHYKHSHLKFVGKKKKKKKLQLNVSNGLCSREYIKTFGRGSAPGPRTGHHVKNQISSAMSFYLHSASSSSCRTSPLLT